MSKNKEVAGAAFADFNAINFPVFARSDSETAVIESCQRPDIFFVRREKNRRRAAARQSINFTVGRSSGIQLAVFSDCQSGNV